MEDLKQAYPVGGGLRHSARARSSGRAARELKSQTPGGYSPFHGFTGKPFDMAVGLQYNDNRWYDPATGRWTGEDPISSIDFPAFATRFFISGGWI